MSSSFDLNRLNAFLNSATKTIACGPDCQKEKISQELKKKYDDAKNNLALAEPQYQVARQNYYTYVSGKNEYDNVIENELNNEADKIVSFFKMFIEKEINKINTQLESYDGISINFSNIKDLLQQYREENESLEKQIKEETNDILTNERKTYYKNQDVDYLNSAYSYVFIIIYIIVVLCFGVLSLIYPSQTHFIIRIILLIFFVLLPFFSTWLLDKIISLIYWLYYLFPKNTAE